MVAGLRRRLARAARDEVHPQHGPRPARPGGARSRPGTGDGPPEPGRKPSSALGRQGHRPRPHAEPAAASPPRRLQTARSPASSQPVRTAAAARWATSIAQPPAARLSASEPAGGAPPASDPECRCPPAGGATATVATRAPHGPARAGRAAPPARPAWSPAIRTSPGLAAERGGEHRRQISQAPSARPPGGQPPSGPGVGGGAHPHHGGGQERAARPPKPRTGRHSSEEYGVRRAVTPRGSARDPTVDARLPAMRIERWGAAYAAASVAEVGARAVGWRRTANGIKPFLMPALLGVGAAGRAGALGLRPPAAACRGPRRGHGR